MLGRAQYAHRGIGEHNYCRAPGTFSYCAWCYTTLPSKEWDCCDVGPPADHCVWLPSPPPPPFPSPHAPPPSPSPRPPPPHPAPPSPPLRLSDRECYTHFQAFDYRGVKNTTSRGFDCQRWSAQSPHAHHYEPRLYASAGLGEHNYCRSVGSFCAWCFTMHEGKPEWDCCDIGPPAERCEILNAQGEPRAARWRPPGGEAAGMVQARRGWPMHASRAMAVAASATALAAFVAAAVRLRRTRTWRPDTSEQRRGGPFRLI